MALKRIMIDPATEELYQAIILDHDRSPRNYGPILPCSHRSSIYNPLCGDQYELYAQVEEGVVKQLGFEGHGCAVSKASLSMMTQLLAGKSISEAFSFGDAVRIMLTEKEGVPDNRLGELTALEAVRPAPTRVKCALLGWDALRSILYQVADD